MPQVQEVLTQEVGCGRGLRFLWLPTLAWRGDEISPLRTSSQLGVPAHNKVRKPITNQPHTRGGKG